MIKYLLIATSFSLLPLLCANLKSDAEEATKKGGGNAVVYINQTPHILQVRQRAYPSSKGALPEDEYVHKSVQPESFFVVDAKEYPSLQGDNAVAMLHIRGGTAQLTQEFELHNLPGWKEKKYRYSITIEKFKNHKGNEVFQVSRRKLE